MCQSACENFFRACGYDEDLWMCSKNVIDDYRLTTTSDAGEESTPYFPGEPFKMNEYEAKRRKSQPKEVCTPSIKGNASGLKVQTITLVVAAVVTLQFLIF